MVIEGLRDFEAVRDHLYSRMRGLKPPEQSTATESTRTSPVLQQEDIAAALAAAAAELRETRLLLARHLLSQAEAEADE
jgi:putative membrane protein